MKPKSLINKRYWLWRAKCRNCGNTTDYTCQKKGESEHSGMTWEQLYKVVTECYAPAKWGKCEHCNAEVLMDVIAMTPRPDA